MLNELHEAADVIKRVVDPDANIIFGMVTDLKMENEIKLTIVATGFPTEGTVDEREAQIDRMLTEALDGAGDGERGDLDLPPSSDATPEPVPETASNRDRLQSPPFPRAAWAAKPMPLFHAAQPNIPSNLTG